MDGTADLGLALGEQQAQLTLSATLAAGASETQLRAQAVAGDAERDRARGAVAGGLAALDAPVGGEATLDLDASLALRDARLSLHAGAGQVRIGDGAVPFLRRRAGGIGHAGAAGACRRCRSLCRGHSMRSADACRARGTMQRGAGPDQRRYLR